MAVFKTFLASQLQCALQDTTYSRAENDYGNCTLPFSLVLPRSPDNYKTIGLESVLIYLLAFLFVRLRQTMHHTLPSYYHHVTNTFAMNKSTLKRTKYTYQGQKSLGADFRWRFVEAILFFILVNSRHDLTHNGFCVG